MRSQRKGSLNVVGSGIKVAAHTSPEAVGCIKLAQKVFYLEADPLTRCWLAELNPNAESLRDLYAVGKERSTTYAEMVERVLDAVRAGNDVCFLSYGHPGVFGNPMHAAVKQARAEGYDARMLPAISSEDCLFADLGVDPASAGCQTFEATDFLIYRRDFDPCTAMVLLQIGVIAERGHKDKLALWNPAGLGVLVETLLESYPGEHIVTVYEAANYACCDPSIQEIPLSRLPAAAVTAISTLYVPPKAAPKANLEMLTKLGLR